MAYILYKNSFTHIMTGKDFLSSIANSKQDVVQLFLDVLNELKINHCVIDGLAINAYAEPVACLDLDLVLAIDDKKNS